MLFSFYLTHPSLPNGRRNGIKIGVFTVSSLFVAHQIVSVFQGKSREIVLWFLSHWVGRKVTILAQILAQLAGRMLVRSSSASLTALLRLLALNPTLNQHAGCGPMKLMLAMSLALLLAARRLRPSQWCRWLTRYSRIESKQRRDNVFALAAAILAR